MPPKPRLPQRLPPQSVAQLPTLVRLLAPQLAVLPAPLACAPPVWPQPSGNVWPKPGPLVANSLPVRPHSLRGVPQILLLLHGFFLPQLLPRPLLHPPLRTQVWTPTAHCFLRNLLVMWILLKAPPPRRLARQRKEFALLHALPVLPKPPRRALPWRLPLRLRLNASLRRQNVWPIRQQVPAELQMPAVFWP